jgi:hypothetical protein
MVSLADEEDVNNWFHYSEYNEMTPAEAVAAFNNSVLKHLESHAIKLRVSEGMFRKKMCTAMCMLAIANYRNMELSNPNSNLPAPKNWNAQAEELWEDYMTTFLFSDEYWESVFKKIPECLWESSVSNWRTTFRYIVLHYVERDVSILAEAGVMFEDSEGELVEAVDYVESENEYD